MMSMTIGTRIIGGRFANESKSKTRYVAEFVRIQCLAAANAEFSRIQLPEHLANELHPMCNVVEPLLLVADFAFDEERTGVADFLER